MTHTTFHRMTPVAANMVVEGDGPRACFVLCVECGWEAWVAVPTAPWVAFMKHPCRLAHTMVGAD